jgi:hypothetical protein
MLAVLSLGALYVTAALAVNQDPGLVLVLVLIKIPLNQGSS